MFFYFAILLNFPSPCILKQCQLLSQVLNWLWSIDCRGINQEIIDGRGINQEMQIRGSLILFHSSWEREKVLSSFFLN